jgi:hypothetical protein
MNREGLTIETQTLWDQLEALGTVLTPTYEALRRYVLTAPVVGADETWWPLLGGPQQKRWWAWSVTRDDAVSYTILESRSHEAARQVLEGYRGIVVADGYGAYETLARAGPGLSLAHCWAHYPEPSVMRSGEPPDPHEPPFSDEPLHITSLNMRAPTGSHGVWQRWAHRVVGTHTRGGSFGTGDRTDSSRAPSPSTCGGFVVFSRPMTNPTTSGLSTWTAPRRSRLRARTLGGDTSVGGLRSRPRAARCTRGPWHWPPSEFLFLPGPRPGHQSYRPIPCVERSPSTSGSIAA